MSVRLSRSNPLTDLLCLKRVVLYLEWVCDRPDESQHRSGEAMATTLPSPTSTTVDVSIPVTGMTCASCVNRVEKAIGKVAGVERAAVNLATERATVAYDPATTNVSEIAHAVERAGYGVADLPPEPVVAPPPPVPASRPDTNGTAHVSDNAG